MLPNAIFSTLQGTQNPNTNQTLQRAKNANTQPTHPSRQITIIICSTLQQQTLTERPSPPTTQQPKEVNSQPYVNSMYLNTIF
jgi:hypothetical protein